ncbi:MAG: hypothetical protein KDE48_16900 [Anaerolineales bacterium]|nr:hypothetical protein [Anaerolineales bacterium]
MANVYGLASSYPQNAGFQFYDITDDAGNWLAMQGIPAITVELTTHETIDWRMNLAGLTASTRKQQLINKLSCRFLIQINS